eukprot:SAG31_NODE_40497_length_280_cov_1.005525_1_plen_26_part_10
MERCARTRGRRVRAWAAGTSPAANKT